MLHHLMPLISSPWLYVVVFLAVAIDGFFPVMPSETLVIGLFAFSATGAPNVVALLATIAAGGIAGDQISYRIGRRAGRLTGRRVAEAREKGEKALQRYGGTAILVGRFIPYGRTATTVTAGSMTFPAGRFRLFSAIAAVAWAVYALGLGRVGGATFTRHPLLGAAFGVALGMIIAAVCALIEKRRSRTVPDQRSRTVPDRRRRETPTVPDQRAGRHVRDPRRHPPPAPCTQAARRIAAATDVNDLPG
ncbi:membrane protein [Actinoplanes cyaneus]|uniref:Membrane protein n=1 Tax=Actinoplanes cyaneus TaxID=52696 RepID=A0A919IQ64_9ACTN|nr:DedA family protein [Actinoplanes cyaneus]MCW2142293.1 membrane protein DedA, SNARE-associated domain [Actinoplanes cyaneus]GID69312.1 membrane protein [Actinoplanes cyaneus]